MKPEVAPTRCCARLNTHTCFADEAPSKGNTNKEITNFVTSRSPAHFAELYRKHGLMGGHVIMLGHDDANRSAAKAALGAYKHGLHVGGGITPQNAKEFLDAGASHVIVTSYIFNKGRLDFGRLQELVDCVGKERLVLDLSCRQKKNNKKDDTSADDEKVASTTSTSSDSPQGTRPVFYVVADRWQTYTSLTISKETLTELSQYCAEFLVHGVDVEGKRQGVDAELIQQLSDWSPIPVTYAGGVRSLNDLELVRRLGKGTIDVTVGSALDIFGGSLPIDTVIEFCAADKE